MLDRVARTDPDADQDREFRRGFVVAAKSVLNMTGETDGVTRGKSRDCTRRAISSSCASRRSAS